MTGKYSSILIAVFFFIAITGNSQSSRQKPIPFDSLRLRVNEAQDAKSKVDAYLRLGSALSAARMPDSLYYYSDKIDTSNIYGMAGKQYLKGLGHYRNRRLNEAIEQLEQAVSVLETENKEVYLQAMMSLGISYNRTKQLEKAKTNYLKMLDFIGEGENPFKAGVYGNLGMVYRSLGDYNRAIELFEQCVALKPDDAFFVANSYMNIANMFGNLEMYESAISTLNQIDTTSILNTPVYIAVNNNLAENYYKSGQFKLAKYYYTIGRRLATKLKQFHLAIRSNIYLSKMALKKNNLTEAKSRLEEGIEMNNKKPFLPSSIAIRLWASEYFVKTNHPDSAIYYANEAISIAKKGNPMLNNVYVLLSEAYEQKNDNESANRYLKQHTTFTDSINDVGHLKTLADARARYEVKETKKALEDTEQQVSFFESLSMKVSLAALGLIGLCGLLYVKFFKQKRVNALNQEEIETLNKQLEAVQNEATENEVPERLLLKSKAILNMIDIMYIKSDGPYVEFYINGKVKPEIDRNTLKSLAEELPSIQFVQVHRSYIVNINYIRSIYATKLMLKSGDDINISRSFKANIEKILVKPV